MPSASTYIIDTSRIYPGEGGKNTRQLNYGSSESKYAMLGDNTIYDKVLYELSVDDEPNHEPDAHEVIFKFNSKRTHGDGKVDTLSINPTSGSLSANTSTSDTKTTTFTVNQALTANGTVTGTGVTVTVTQIKDYPVSATLELGVPDVIGAGGGTVSSVSWTATTTFKSGNVVVGSSIGSTTFNTVTASSKGYTASNQTTVGTLTGTYTYTCNGHNVTASASTTVYQAKNEITNSNYAPFNYWASVSIGTGMWAGGGSATVTHSAGHSAYDYYSSGSYNPTSHAVTDSSTIAITSNGNSRFSLAGNTLTHYNMTTNNVTDTVTVKATNSSNTSATATDSKSITNGYSDSWNNPVVTITPNGTTVGSGATSQAFTASASQSGTRTYDSNSTSSCSNSSFTWSWSSDSSDFTASSTSTACTVTFSANPNSSSRSATITATASANSKSGSKGVTLTQEAKEDNYMYIGFPTEYNIDYTINPVGTEVIRYPQGATIVCEIEGRLDGAQKIYTMKYEVKNYFGNFELIEGTGLLDGLDDKVKFDKGCSVSMRLTPRLYSGSSNDYNFMFVYQSMVSGTQYHISCTGADFINFLHEPFGVIEDSMSNIFERCVLFGVCFYE